MNSINEIADVVSNFTFKNVDEKLENVKAFFKLPVAVEYLTSEMLIASSYRSLGMKNMTDRNVMINGRALTQFLRKHKEIKVTSFNQEQILKMLKSVLISPEDTRQNRNKDYPDDCFLAPLVPATAYFSNPVKLSKRISSTSHDWNVGTLLKSLICFASHNVDDANNLWSLLFSALSIEGEHDEDYFAIITERLLQGCVEALKSGDTTLRDNFPVWEEKVSPFCEDEMLKAFFEVRNELADISPFDEIRHGIREVIALKKKLSRWQWITMLDAQLRITVTAFVIWMLDLYHVVNCAIEKYVLSGEPLPTVDNPCDLFKNLYKEYGHKYTFSYGEGASKTQKRIIERYSRDSLKLGCFLFFTEKEAPELSKKINWSSISGVIESLKPLCQLYANSEIRERYAQIEIGPLVNNLNKQDAKKGRLKHLDEFFSVLRQKMITEQHRDLMRYDQSYYVRKKGDYSSAPFIFDIGAVAYFSIIYCCSKGRRTFSIKEFLAYLEKYYVSVNDAHRAQFIDHLKGLGLTMDSPDAEDALAILNHFYSEGI